MKNYRVVKPVSDSRDNHKRYDAGQTITLDEARAAVLLERGVIAELEEGGQEPEAEPETEAEPEQEPAAEPEAEPEPLVSGLFEKEEVTKEDKGKGKTKPTPKGK